MSRLPPPWAQAEVCHHEPSAASGRNPILLNLACVAQTAAPTTVIVASPVQSEPPAGWGRVTNPPIWYMRRVRSASHPTSSVTFSLTASGSARARLAWTDGRGPAAPCSRLTLGRHYSDGGAAVPVGSEGGDSGVRVAMDTVGVGGAGVAVGTAVSVGTGCAVSDGGGIAVGTCVSVASGVDVRVTVAVLVVVPVAVNVGVARPNRPRSKPPPDKTAHMLSSRATMTPAISTGNTQRCTSSRPDLAVSGMAGGAGGGVQARGRPAVCTTVV